MNFTESIQEVCRKLNISYSAVAGGTDDLFAIGDFKSWLNLAVQRAWDYARWIFSEKAVYTQTAQDQDYYDYPADFISDSIHILKVENQDGKMETYKKIRFEDYQRYREEQAEGKDKIFTDFKRFYFINPKAFTGVVARKIEIWGKKRALILINDTDLLPFSPETDNEENSGNLSIVLLAYAMALDSDKKKDVNKALIMERKALEILETIAKREQEEQTSYRGKDNPMFSVPKFI